MVLTLALPTVPADTWLFIALHLAALAVTLILTTEILTHQDPFSAPIPPLGDTPPAKPAHHRLWVAVFALLLAGTTAFTLLSILNTLPTVKTEPRFILALYFATMAPGFMGLIHFACQPVKPYITDWTYLSLYLVAVLDWAIVLALANHFAP